MAFLQALGRAQPGTQIQNFLSREEDIKTKQKNQAVADLNIQRVQQDIDINARKEETAIAEEKASLVEHDIGRMLDKFEGGREGAVGQEVHKMLVAQGFADMSGGGLGTINRKRGEKAWEAINDPVFEAKISRTRINSWRQQEAQALEASKNKPGDEKIQAELQRIQDGLDQALGQDQAMREGAEERRTKKGETGKLPTTAMAAFLQENPDATTEELLDFTQKLAVAKEGTQEEDEGTKLNQLINEYNNSPTDDPFRPQRLSNINKEATRTGQRTTINAETGEVIIETGIGGADFSRKTQGSIEENIINSREARVRAEKILDGFDPSFLTFSGKAKSMLLNIKDKATGQLTQEESKFQQDISVFMQDAVENINLYIKAITGAQMSEKEATRLRKAVGDAGDDIFSGDGPVKFKAKIENAIRKAKLSEARMLILRDRGFTLPTDKAEIEKALVRIETSFNDSKVLDTLNEEANKIGETLSLQFKEKTDEEIMGMVRDRMKEKYGL